MREIESERATLLSVLERTAARRWTLPLIIVIGVAIRLFFAFNWFGNGDVLSFALVGQRTADGSALHTYGGNVGEGVNSAYWPYPPGYLAWLVSAFRISDLTGIELQGLVHVLPIAADVGIATLVYVYLGMRGASPGIRLAGLALVMLGPVFIAISGYHGQFDAVAILPGLLALIVWESRPGSKRALETGLLIGLGAILKTVPILLLVPLLCSARSKREALVLAGSAIGALALVCLPFLVAEPEGFRQGLEYAGVPGRGGLSVVFDPGFAADRREDAYLALVGEPNGIAQFLSTSSGAITLVLLAGLGAFIWRYRPATIDAIVLLWLGLFVFNANFLPQYLIWALPFFIMAGYLAKTALLQIAVVPLLLLAYLSSTVYERPGSIAYAILAICLWLIWVVALASVIRRVVRRRRTHPRGTQNPVVALPSAGQPPAATGIHPGERTR